MKRTRIACLLFALVAATLATPADAAKRNEREPARRATATYDNPAFGLASGAGGAACLPCPTFTVSPRERWVKMEVHDDVSPAPVAFDIRQRRPDGSCCAEIGGPFCGSTGRQPVEIRPGLDVLVFVFPSGDTACPGAFGTRGTAVAVFRSDPHSAP